MSVLPVLTRSGFVSLDRLFTEGRTFAELKPRRPSLLSRSGSWRSKTSWTLSWPGMSGLVAVCPKDCRLLSTCLGKVKCYLWWVNRQDCLCLLCLLRIRACEAHHTGRCTRAAHEHGRAQHDRYSHRPGYEDTRLVTHRHMSICIHIHKHIYIYTHTHVHTIIDPCMHAYMHTYIVHTSYLNIDTYLSISMSIPISLYVHTHTHTSICTHTHTHDVSSLSTQHHLTWSCLHAQTKD